MTTNRLLRLNDLTNEIEEIHAGTHTRRRLVPVAFLEAGGHTVEEFTRAWMEDHGIQADDSMGQVGPELEGDQADGATSDA